MVETYFAHLHFETDLYFLIGSNGQSFGMT